MGDITIKYTTMVIFLQAAMVLEEDLGYRKRSYFHAILCVIILPYVYNSPDPISKGLRHSSFTLLRYLLITARGLFILEITLDKPYAKYSWLQVQKQVGLYIFQSMLKGFFFL